MLTNYANFNKALDFLKPIPVLIKRTFQFYGYNFIPMYAIAQVFLQNLNKNLGKNLQIHLSHHIIDHFPRIVIFFSIVEKCL